jgi:putative ABC transport system permease protein
MSGRRRSSSREVPRRFSGLRTARLSLRFAAREAWRTRGQSLLIVLLIVIPVAAVAAVATIGQSRIPTVAESIQSRMGDAQAVLRVVSPPDSSLIQLPTEPQNWQVDVDQATGLRKNSDRRDPLASPSSVLPQGTPIIEVRDSALITVATATGRGSLLYVEGAVWESALTGLYALERGRAPRSAGEVLVTPSTLDRLGKGLGDDVSVFEPNETTMRIVGTIRDRTLSASVDAIYAPIGTLATGTPSIKDARFFLPSTPLSWARVAELNKSGFIVWSREVLQDPPSSDMFVQIPDGERATEGLIAGIAIFALLEVTLLAGAAFLVGARRQQRTLALLASVGARRRNLFQIVTGGGVLLGAIAGVVGAALGVLGAYLAYRITDTGDRIEFPGFHIDWLLLIGVVAAATVVGWVAAAVPAVIASRVDVVVALRGATRPSPARRSVTRAGLILLSVGVLLLAGSTFVLAGTEWVNTLAKSTLHSRPIMVVGILGISLAAVVLHIAALLLVPQIFAWVSARLGRASLPVRLAARDLSRNTARSAPVVAVIMTTVWIALVTLCFQAYQGTIEAAYRTDSALTGQGFLPTFTEANPNPTVAESHAQSQRLAALARSRFDDARVSVIQRPQTDWTSYWAGAGQMTELKAVRAPEQLCPAEAGAPGYPTSDDPAVLRAFGEKHGDDPRCDIRNAPLLFSAGGPGVFHVLIGGPRELARLTGTTVAPGIAAALAGGEAVSFWPQLVHDDRITLQWSVVATGLPDSVIRTEELRAVVAQPRERLLDGIFISPDTAKKLGIFPVDGLVLIDFASPPSVSTVDAANADFVAAVPGVGPLVVVRDPAEAQRTTNWLALALVMLVALSAATVALGLGRIDGRKTQLTLRAIGGGYRVVRGMSAASVAIMTLLATVIGVLTALIPLYCIFGITDVPFSPPWLQIVVIVVGFPVLFAIGGWLLPPQRSTRRL